MPAALFTAGEVMSRALHDTAADQEGANSKPPLPPERYAGTLLHLATTALTPHPIQRRRQPQTGQQRLLYLGKCTTDALSLLGMLRAAGTLAPTTAC
jgi:hypothetical protein